MKRNIKKFLYIAIIIFFMVAIVPKTLQNDTFFSIADGRVILENGIQKEEQLVLHKGLETTNARWLFDVLITLIYNQFDFLRNIYFCYYLFYYYRSFILLYIIENN